MTTAEPKRVTVTIKLPNEESPRRFHLLPAKASAFSASIRAEGGEATIEPLQIGAETKMMLDRLGIIVR